MFVQNCLAWQMVSVSVQVTSENQGPNSQLWSGCAFKGSGLILSFSWLNRRLVAYCQSLVLQGRSGECSVVLCPENDQGSSGDHKLLTTKGMHKTALDYAGTRIRVKNPIMVKLWLCLCLSKPFSQLMAENLTFSLWDPWDTWQEILQCAVWIPDGSSMCNNEL